MKIWIFQSGEPLHTDADNLRPMRAMNLANVLLDRGHEVVLWSSSFFHQEKRHRSEGYEVLKPRDRLEIRLIPSPGYQKNIGVGRIYDHVKLAKNLLTALKNSNNKKTSTLFITTIAILVAKLIYEQVGGTSNYLSLIINRSVAIDAHLFGAISGFIFWLFDKPTLHQS